MIESIFLFFTMQWHGIVVGSVLGAFGMYVKIHKMQQQMHHIECEKQELLKQSGAIGKTLKLRPKNRG